MIWSLLCSVICIRDRISTEESKVVEFIFTSSYRREKHRLIHEKIVQLEPAKQAEAFLPVIEETLREFPDCEMLLEPLLQFFGFLQKTPANELSTKGFPYSPKQLNQEKILGWLIQYFQSNFLDKEAVHQILLRYAEKNNLPPDSVPEVKYKECFLESISSNNHLNQLVIEFLEFLMERLPHNCLLYTSPSPRDS